jgi:hypothetical protein
MSRYANQERTISLDGFLLPITSQTEILIALATRVARRHWGFETETASLNLRKEAV